MAEALEEALEQLKEQQSRRRWTRPPNSWHRWIREQAAEMQEQALRDLAPSTMCCCRPSRPCRWPCRWSRSLRCADWPPTCWPCQQRQEEIVARIPPRLRDVRSLELTREPAPAAEGAPRVRENLAGTDGRSRPRGS